MIHLDTHVVVWLYAGETERLRGCLHRLEGQVLVISPMVVLECQYLFEIDKIAVRPEVILAELGERAGLTVSAHPFADVAHAALAMAWTRDPFDRLIAAQAVAEGVALVTADRVMLANCPAAVWD
jgi:PIN domain nuclease of toxin-antitoxin system